MLKPFNELVKLDVRPLCGFRDAKDERGNTVKVPYLGWANCVKLLHENGAESVWYAPRRCPETNSYLWPQAKVTTSKGRVTECWFVSVEIHIDENVFSYDMPLLNGSLVVYEDTLNQLRINNALARAFVKGVAVRTGLGFDLWAAGADAAVLLGTQMIAKGLDFDEVTLVGVINADTMLHLPDFRSSERTFDLIEQVAGRSGRADLPGRVIVQTYSAGDAAIRSAAHYDREGFLERELELRKNLHYPPYVRMANVLIWGASESEVIGVSQQLFLDLIGLLEEQGVAGIQVFPPTPCVLSRLKKNYRYHILIKAAPEQDIAAFCSDYFRGRKPHKSVNVSIDIDPVSVL